MMTKILSNIGSELKLIFVPTIQFLLGSWLLIVLVTTLWDNTFQTRLGVGIFLLAWGLCLLSFLGMFRRYKKYALAYRLASGVAFIALNGLLPFVIEKYGV